MLRAALAVTAVLASSTAARGDDDAFLFVAGHLGLNLPVGAIGGEVGVGLDWARAAVSLGRGFRGVSMAAMARAVTAVAGVDVGFGLGISRGPGLYDVPISFGEGDDEPEALTHYGDATRWLDAEVSAELALSDHGFVRFTLGMTRAFDIDCDSEDRTTDEAVPCDAVQIAKLHDAGFLPYLGIAFGVRFPEAPSTKPRYAIPAAPAPFMLPPPPIAPF